MTNRVNISQIFAIAQKEIRLNLRFGWNYFGETLIYPFRYVFIFFLIYKGFFTSGAQGIGDITRTNYLAFLVLGGLAHTFFNTAFNVFRTKFLREKYWQTISTFLIAPAHRLKLVIGIGLAELLRLGIILVIFLSIAYFFKSIPFIKLAAVISIILLTYLGTLGVSLIAGAFALANENILFLFVYLQMGWTVLSCFYYPLSSIPGFLRPLVMVNPVYHSVTLIRELWLGLPGNTALHLCFIIPFAVLAPILGAYLFNNIIKKMGVTGY